MQRSTMVLVLACFFMAHGARVQAALPSSAKVLSGLFDQSNSAKWHRLGMGSLTLLDGLARKSGGSDLSGAYFRLPATVGAFDLSVATRRTLHANNDLNRYSLIDRDGNGYSAVLDFRDNSVLIQRNDGWSNVSTLGRKKLSTPLERGRWYRLALRRHGSALSVHVYAIDSEAKTLAKVQVEDARYPSLGFLAIAGGMVYESRNLRLEYQKTGMVPDERLSFSMPSPSAKGGKDCKPPRCPLPPLTYQPTLPPLGHYSVAGYCDKPIDETLPQLTWHENVLVDGVTAKKRWAAGEVLMSKSHGKRVYRLGSNSGKGERARDLWKRAEALSKKTGNRGLIINVRWDAPPIQCDILYSPKNHGIPKLVLRGIRGPDGEMPWAYCRADRRQGTVPTKLARGSFLSATVSVMQNMHIDGYRNAINVPHGGDPVFRNNWMHHQLSNGISQSNYGGKRPNKYGSEFCGNELSHAGNSNGEHGFYMHTAVKPPSSNSVVLLDNTVFSTAWSSGFKSIANRNLLLNNVFATWLPADTSWPVMYAQALVDIAGCAENIIDGNQFYYWKHAANAGGADSVQLRDRKTVLRGCHRPPYGSDRWNDPRYWLSLHGAKLPELSTIVRNNQFFARPPFDLPSGARSFDKKAVAIKDFGTGPLHGPGFGTNILLPLPKKCDDQGNCKVVYYERHETVVENNSYHGFGKKGERAYKSVPMWHCRPGRDNKRLKRQGFKDGCPPAPYNPRTFMAPRSPNFPAPGTKAGYFRIGEGEHYE